MTRQQRATRGLRIGILGVIVLAVLAGIAVGVFWNAPISRLLGRGDGAAQISTGSPTSAKKQLWTCGMHPQVIREEPGLCPICEMELTPVQTDSSSAAQGAAGERKVTYWWDPMMNPPYIAKEPGKSPMGMDLIPVYEDEIMAGASVTIDPVVVQNMGVRIAPVTEGPVEMTIRATGYLMEPDPNHLDINLRVGGWIEKLYANIDGMRIQKGDPLFDLYSPEVQVAVEELISVRKSLTSTAGESSGNTSELIYETARRKLENWGLTTGQIEKLEAMDRAPRTVTFFSPLTGHVTEKRVYEGAAVEAGQMALRLADNSTMWLDIRIFEHQLPHVRLGQKVDATVQAVPGKSFTGEVIFIHPHLDDMTRTALVRIAIPNPDLVLRQEMFGTAELHALITDRAMLIPREAVIDTGERQVAFVATSGGHFEPRRVEMGARTGDGLVQVLSGLSAGEAVVTSGQFLLDSESRLKEAIQKHLSANLPQPATASEMQPAETQPEPELLVDAWVPEVDALITEYLKIAAVLGEKQTESTPTTVNVDALVAAADHLIQRSSADVKSLAAPVAESVKVLAGQPIDQQRETFKKVSDAMIALARRVPPSTVVAQELFIAYCPMAPGSWLQTQEEIVNPYYATTMKRCGEIKGKIATMEKRP
jgi:Cu(I)/Ag(I) efflux system membrane fusion protein/cobalt-zinc-cadmium efflux system membrane fusion protein